MQLLSTTSKVADQIIPKKLYSGTCSAHCGYYSDLMLQFRLLQSQIITSCCKHMQLCNFDGMQLNEVRFWESKW